MSVYRAKPNEYYMLRRAARRLIEALLSSVAYWDSPGEIANVFAAVVLLKSCADKIEPALIERNRDWWYAP